jgi:hypothetical protein
MKLAYFLDYKGRKKYLPAKLTVAAYTFYDLTTSPKIYKVISQS